jgi:DNA-binding transcriptional ArsR family regulator
MRERVGKPKRQGRAQSDPVVLAALDERSDMTVAEIATATGLGRSTVSTTLVRMEGTGKVRRREGGREGARRLPDQWRRSRRRARKSSEPAAGRLRPGQLDELVLAYVRKRTRGEPVGPTAVANALGRSSGAVANCLKRSAKAGKVRQTGEDPLRYQHAR